MSRTLLVLIVLSIFVTIGWGMFRIGITAIVDHPALDATRNGVIDELVKRGYVLDKDFQVEYQSAQGNMNTAVSIANYFNTGNFDIVVAISTPSAQTCANAIKTFPVVFSAVTDPVAASLIPALGKNPGNVVGISDMTPVKTQIQLIKFLLPLAEKIGIMTNPGEANSLVITEHAKIACKELGLELIEIVGTNTSEMIAALSAMIGEVDAVYIGTDNTAASCIESLQRIAVANKVLLICADVSLSRASGVIGYGSDYYGLGLDTGSIVWELLNGMKPSDIESRLIKAGSLQLYLNLDVAKQINLTIPDSLKERASFILENGVETQPKSQ